MIENFEIFNFYIFLILIFLLKLIVTMKKFKKKPEQNKYTIYVKSTDGHVFEIIEYI